MPRLAIMEITSTFNFRLRNISTILLFFITVIDAASNYHWIQKRGVGDFFDSRTYTKFILYTRNNPQTGEQLILNDRKSLDNSYFNRSCPTRFMIHGWMNNQFSMVNTMVRNAYLQKGDFNVIIVDWSFASFSDYLASSRNIRRVGEAVGKFLDFLNSSFDIPLESIYVAGHSLGAQIAGFAGRAVRRGRIGVIFALDPAGPGFSEASENTRVSKNSAVYVESIQTNIGTLGYRQPIGTASFYPNFGAHQAGCAEPICSHMRAAMLFAESINSKEGFIARKCANFEEISIARQCTSTGENEIMGGEPARTNRSGVFYMPTNSFSPFALGSRGV